MRYIRECHRRLYIGSQLSGKPDSCLSDIVRQAEEMLRRLVNQQSRQRGRAENLKATDQMTWIGRMNHVREQAATLQIQS